MNFKKIISIALIATMSFSLVACGSKKAGNNASSSSGSNKNDVVIDIPTGSEAHYYKTEYITNLPKNFNNVGTTVMANDSLYYTCSDDTNSETLLCSYNLLTGEETTYYAMDNNNDPLAEHSYANQFTVDDAGNLVAYISTYRYDDALSKVDVSGTTEEDLIQYYAENYGYGMSTEAILSDLKKYYYETYTDADGNVDYGKIKLMFVAWDYDTVYTYRLAKFDKSGNEIFSTPIETQDNMSLDVYNMVTVDDNTALLFIDWSGDSPVYTIGLYDAQGKNYKNVKVENGCESIMKDLKGNLCVSRYSDTGYDYYKVDLESGAVEEKPTLSMSGYGTPRKYDDTHYYINYGDQLTLVSEDGSESERLIKWIDNDISSVQVSDSIIFSDGNIGAFMSKYSAADEKMKYEFAKLIEIPESEVVKKQPINLAAIYVDSTLEEKIIDFNRHSNDYRIYVVSFDYTQTYDDYDVAQKNYMTALAANNDIDIIVFSYGQYGTFLNLASKGLFVDLAPLMTTPGVKKDDFIPSIIAPLTMNDKLYALPNNFAVETVLGAARDVGTKPGWTVDDAKKLLESKPEGTKFMSYMTRERMLQNLIDLNYSEFVDTANVTCNFDNDDFKKVLEFANLFPVETEDDMIAYEMEDDTELLASGKVLLQDYYINNFSEYQMYKRIYDDDVTYIGFPTSNGNGAMINYDSLYTITKNCATPEAAWSMLSTLFESAPNTERYSNFSARKDDFDSFCKKAMEPKGDSEEIYGWGKYEVKIQPATQEEVDVVKDLIYNVTAVRGAVSTEVMNIILEEADAYFKGAKSVDEVASIIQSRVRVYLSETN